MAKFAVETKLARLAVEIWEAKFAVETKLARFAVETWPTRFALEIYPALPNPITVDVKLDAKPIDDTNPAVPRPITVEVSSAGSINVLIYCVRPRDVLRSCELEI